MEKDESKLNTVENIEIGQALNLAVLLCIHKGALGKEDMLKVCEEFTYPLVIENKANFQKRKDAMMSEVNKLGLQQKKEEIKLVL